MTLSMPLHRPKTVEDMQSHALRTQGSAAAGRTWLRSRSLVFRTGGLILLACIMLLGLTAWREWRARVIQLQEVNTALVNLASSLSQHAEDTFEVADATLVGIVERLETNGTAPTALARLEQLLVTRTAALPRVRDYVIYDEDGNWLATSMPAKGGNNADRPYFQHHRAVPDRGGYIGTPFRSRTSGRWTVAVTRRFEHPDGRFAGVVMASIDMSYFVDDFATYKLGTKGTVLLLATTGTLLARYPFEEKAIGQDFSSQQVFKALQKSPVGNYDGVASIDGVKRFAGYRQSARYPLVVTVGMSEDQALGAWRADALVDLAVACGLTGLVLLLGWYLARHMSIKNASEARVRESEGRYRTLADSTSDAITSLDLEGKRTYVSPAFRTVFGYEPEEVIGQPLTAIVHPDDVEAIRRRMQPLLLGESERTQLTYRAYHKQGHWVWAESSLSLLRDTSTGSPASMICSVRDISERHAQADELKRTNAELERLARELTGARDKADRASRAKTRFLAGISHELRTPLNGIMGYAQLMQMEGGLNAGQVTRVDAMLGAGAHLLEMINSVLDLSQIESEQFELQATGVDLRSVAAASLDLVRPAADAKRLALRLFAAPDVPQCVMTDPVRLRQMLLNLLGNAVKFTAAGSVELRIRTISDGARLRLEVVDTGPGIPSEHRAQLFQDFQRLGADAIKVEGAGLGLALSSRLAALMGGSIGQEENPRGGSLFWLDLPLLVSSASAQPDNLVDVLPQTSVAHSSVQLTPAGRSLRILVVDDVAMNRDIANSFLLSGGHEVVCKEDGAEGVEAAEANDFDVILMDVRMPGMDGLEATRRIRNLAGSRGRVPIVALTAQAFVEQAEECRQAGMNSHLSKPFTPAALFAVVAQAAESHIRSERAIHAEHSEPLRSDPGSLHSKAGERSGTASQMPILHAATFEQTTAYLKPAVSLTYLQALVEQCETLLHKLQNRDGLEDDWCSAATLAHSLGGSAGLFGFQRLADTAARFERAIKTKSLGRLGMLEGLTAAIEISIFEMQRAMSTTTAGKATSD